MFFLLTSCNKKKVNTVGEYSKWINDPQNGLVLKRNINGLKITVKYLPADYLVYKDGEQLETLKEGSQSKSYENAITFLMNIAPDEDEKNDKDIMFRNISSYKEYSERLLSMNFEIDKSIELKAGSVKLKPALCVFENTYGLSNSRTLVVAFAPTKAEKSVIENVSEIDFIYDDELFQLGCMHFNFDQKNIKNLPLITQWQK